jgi:hypothetical protein
MVGLNIIYVSHLLISADAIPAHVQYQRDRKTTDWCVAVQLLTVPAGSSASQKLHKIPVIIVVDL